MKSVPFTVSVKAAAPVVLVVGEMLVSVGTGLLIANWAGIAVPPPGVGLKTVMFAMPVAAISAAAICAVN